MSELDRDARQRRSIANAAERGHVPGRESAAHAYGERHLETTRGVPGRTSGTAHLAGADAAAAHPAEKIERELERVRRFLASVEAKADPTGGDAYNLCSALGALKRVFEQAPAHGDTAYAAYLELRRRAAAQIPSLESEATANTSANASPITLAERGVANASEAFPHAQTLQPLFGRHDLSRIKAQVGGPAADAARALGARAYAIGDRVGFASAPDVHEAAHEAVHVIDHQVGVALKAEVDAGERDPRELRADAIADAAVRGERVEAQLDRGSGSSSVAAVHRKRDGDASNAGRPSALAQFLNIHEAGLRGTLVEHMRDAAWPDPASDVRFAPGGEQLFTASLVRAVASKLTDAEALQQLVRPGDLVERFHKYVDLHHANDSRGFGLALAQLVQWAARDALVERVGPRYRTLWASRFDPPNADELIGRHPMDAFVAGALTIEGVVDLSEMPAVEQQVPATADTAHGRSQRSRADRHPRNEQAPGSKDTSAPTVVQLMAIERDIGTRLDAIRDQVVRLGFTSELRNAYDARAKRVVLLADGDAATRARYLPVLQFQHAQLIAISGPLSEVVSRYWPLRMPDIALTPERRADRDHLHELLTTYVRAAASSHDKEKSTAILRQIETRDRQKQRDRIDAAQVEAEIATSDTIATTPYHAPTGNVEGRDVTARQRQAMLDGTAKGRSKYEQQKAITTAGEVALIARMQSAEHALLQLRAAAIEVYGDEEGLSRAFPQLRPLPLLILDVKDRLADVDRTWDAAIEKNTPLVQEDPHAPDDWAQWTGRKEALPIAQQAFAKIAGKQDLVDFLNEAAKEIRHQAIVNAVVQLAAALLITLATGMGAAALGARAAAALATEGSGLALRGLALAADLSINVTINTAVQLAISQPTRRRKVDPNGKEVEESDGAIAGSMLLENLLMDGFMRTVSLPLRKAQQTALAEARELSALPHLQPAERQALSSFSFAGTQMSVELVGGIATQWAAHHLVETARMKGEEISEPFAMTVLQQGAAIGLGRFFHGQLATWHKHRDALAKTRIGQLPDANALFAAREAFYARAKEVAESLSPEPAAQNELLQANEALIQQERALFAGHKTGETAAAHGNVAQPGPTHAEVTKEANHGPSKHSTKSVEIEAVTSSLPVLDRIESITGVEKGPAYEHDMAALRQFYTEMEAEAQHGVHHGGVTQDGGYGWAYGHKAFTFSHGLVNFEVRVYLDGSNVSGAELKQLQQQVHRGVDHHYNLKKLMVRGPDGIERRLHLEVAFVADPNSADIKVAVFPGNGYAHLNKWYVDGNPTTHAHEVTHGAFGIKDEYVDPHQLSPDRLHDKSRGVYIEQPPSIMGDYWIGDPVVDNKADPGTSIKQRHLDEISKHVPGAPQTAVTAPAKHAPPSPVGNTHALKQAIEQLSSIPVSVLPAGTKVVGEATALDRDTYYVSPHEGGQMLRALAALSPEGIETRVFKKGFIVRRGADEWYFEFHIEPAKHGAEASSAERDKHGLPPANAATVELWGFRGVREIHGRPEAQWTDAERALVEQTKRTDTLLYAGHIGLSLDGGKTIVGFNPEKPEHMDIMDFLKSLLDHDAYPGIVKDDTDLFGRARKMAAEHGWSTQPLSVVELVDKPKKLEILREVARLSNMAPGTHGLGFSFPLKASADGEHFASSNGFEGSCVRNCAAFPEKVGVPIPERSGNLRKYMPELQGWANEDGPKDFRSKKREEGK